MSSLFCPEFGTQTIPVSAGALCFFDDPAVIRDEAMSICHLSHPGLPTNGLGVLLPSWPVTLFGRCDLTPAVREVVNSGLNQALLCLNRSFAYSALGCLTSHMNFKQATMPKSSNPTAIRTIVEFMATPGGAVSSES